MAEFFVQTELDKNVVNLAYKYFMFSRFAIRIDMTLCRMNN